MLMFIASRLDINDGMSALLILLFLGVSKDTSET